MRKFSLLLVLLALLVAAVAPVNAQDEPQSIAAIAAGNPDFATLVAAAQAAGLVEALDQTGPYTVFAPTNDAFAAAIAALGTTPEELLGNTDLLTQVLLYHVVPGTFMAEDVAGALAMSAEMEMDGFSIATANGQAATISTDGTNIFIDGATIVSTDIVASNGVIHVIDAVILPELATEEPGAEATEEPTMEEPTGSIPEVAAAAGTFSTLLAAAQAAGLVDALTNGGPYTVFAPSDEAFAATLTELGLTAEAVLADTELLTAILTYHVVSFPFYSEDVVGLNGAYIGTLLPGYALAITVDENGNVFVNDAQVVAVDIAATNGVIHVIDSVLIPDLSEDM
ncbi:MAG: fasciclin domain-containing protein [Anaerolineae bacterium]|nr:MAG: fasciclin domain-containing protein [Anaerolineae bacterium]